MAAYLPSQMESGVGVSDCINFALLTEDIHVGPTCSVHVSFTNYAITILLQVKISGQQHSTSCLFMTKDHLGSLTFLPVEGYAVHYYTSIEGWPKALHTKGSLFSSLFALLMWDVIFSAEVSVVFRSSYQVQIILNAVY